MCWTAALGMRSNRLGRVACMLRAMRPSKTGNQPAHTPGVEDVSITTSRPATVRLRHNSPDSSTHSASGGCCSVKAYASRSSETTAARATSQYSCSSVNGSNRKVARNSAIRPSICCW